MRLLILRHAKSGHPPCVEDFDRPLCKKGRCGAFVIGSWLRARAIRPALVLCSPSQRARETLALTLRLVRPRPEIRYDAELYLAELPLLLQRIRSAPPVSPLMLVGHNPGLHELALSLLATRQTGEARTNATELSRSFPPAGLAILDFGYRKWAGVRPGSGSMAAYVHPKSPTMIPGE
jgi:phosphohistidine phosphatase